MLRMASVLQSSNVEHDVVNELVTTVENLKISTLVNAAKISPLVQERTIGPRQTNGVNHKHENVLFNNDNNFLSIQSPNNQRTHSKTIRIDNNAKFRKDVWREVNIDSEREETPKKVLQLNDCKAISFRLAATNAEKQRRAKISTDLQVKQNQWDTELEERLQLIRIDSAEKQKRIHAKRMEREQFTLAAIEKIEAQAQQDEINVNLKKTEMIEHSRKLIEHANHLKRQDEMRLLFESVNASKILFINLFELYAKTMINHQGLLNQTGKLAEYMGKRDALLQRYEAVINSVNAKPITLAETEQFEKLCSDIKQEQNELNNHIQSSKENVNQNAVALKTFNNGNGNIGEPGLQAPNESATTTTKNSSEVLRMANANEVSVTDGNAGKPSIPTSNHNAGAKDRIALYHELMNTYQDYKNQIQPLLADVNMKKFRFNCQKGVNTPVNSISAVSPQHLQDKFEKISDLLSGKAVRTGDIQFTALEHPLGIKYCTLLLAKKFITQGTTVTSSHHQAAFPIAAIIVSICQLFPDVGKLFLALLYVECPFFVPYFIPQAPGQSENEYFSLLGYKFIDGKMEEQEQYLKRISGLQRLYSAVLITKPRRSQQHLPHSHGLEHAWIWLTNFLMIDPLPGISSTLLLEFMRICGADLWIIYKKQFTKLLMAIHNQYMPKLDKIDTGGPYSRLRDLLTTIINENKLLPPDGTIKPHFW